MRLELHYKDKCIPLRYPAIIAVVLLLITYLLGCTANVTTPAHWDAMMWGRMQMQESYSCPACNNGAVAESESNTNWLSK